MPPVRHDEGMSDAVSARKVKVVAYVVREGFRFCWLPIRQAHVLAGGQGALLGRLPAKHSLSAEPNKIT
jgi:hypothetical protein